ncbi:hypothetical protein, partial [Shewanella algae]|uniref:hypothetical protein n=1 Tax=Shewanella algae TaxID=38313 RepID=UPI00313BE275
GTEARPRASGSGGADRLNKTQVIRTPGADAGAIAATGAATPLAAAVAAGAALARSVPIDRSKYETVRDVETLARWIAEARAAGRS